MTPPLDPAVLESLTSLGQDDASFVDEVLSTYITQAERIISDMTAALHTGDDETLRRAAHALAGASLNVGATKTARICRRIEDGGSNANHVLALHIELAKVSSFLAERG